MSTNQLSPERVQRSRNMQSDILHAVAETKQINVAKCLGVDSSTVGRWIDSKNPDSQVVRFCDMLAFCGLKIVPANTKHYDAKKIEILFRITKDHFQRLDAVDDFFQNDAGMYDTSDDVRYSRVDGLSDMSNPKIVFELLGRCLEACKSLVASKKYSREPIMLTAKPASEHLEREQEYARKARLARQIIDECEQEAKDKEADEAAFWKLSYVLFHVAMIALVIYTLINFWGK